VTVPSGTSNIATSRTIHGSPHFNRAAPPLRNRNVPGSERLLGKGCWPHPRVRSLSRGGPGGQCRYPEDRVPPHTSSKSRQKIRRAHMPTCPMAPDPASRLGVAVGPSRVPVTLPLGSGQLRGHHVSMWL
jgi:hypothetical protein